MPKIKLMDDIPPLMIVDAFCDGPFTGNPAAVCILPEPRSDRWMQHFAAEMNLSETAFLLQEGESYRLRWFTPAVEVDLCGHATLASAYLILSRFDPGRLTRFWFAPESIVLAGRVKAGGTATLRTSIEHLNPSAQGRVTNPEWSAVRGLRVPGGEGTAELVTAQPRGGEFVDIAFRFTPASGRSGPMYVPVEITTGSGSGLVYVAVTVEP